MLIDLWGFFCKMLVDIRSSFFFFNCSGFCHTLKWISHGFSCVPHPDPPFFIFVLSFLSFLVNLLYLREWQPTPVFLPGKSSGQRSLAGYSPWGHKEPDRTEWLTTFFFFLCVRSYSPVGCKYWKIITQTIICLCLCPLFSRNL